MDRKKGFWGVVWGVAMVGAHFIRWTHIQQRLHDT